MKILIAGLGSIGRRHLRNLAALGQRDVLLYRTGKGTLRSDEFDAYETVTDWREAIARRPDAVVVSNPTSLHLDVAIPAAEAGCHLLLEKPISDSMERVDDLRRAIRQGGGRLLMGFQFRHHPTLRKVKDLVEMGELGQVLSARAYWGEYVADWHPWEDFRVSYAVRRDLGGGVLLTLCHPFDYLRWIFGEVASARGLVGYGLDLEVEAFAETSLQLESGLLASVHLNYLQRPATHHLEVVGEKGHLRWNGMTGDLEIRVASQDEWQRHPAPAGFERNEMFLAEMRHFLEVAAGSVSPICSLEDGVRVQELVEQIRTSAHLDDHAVAP
ncbi:MAG TPA: Gfo/Idh/MocA family oxidoreductase [Anaerolineales bacterium]|nr:Gfo/Idh/MocA family oxidoreductase [Anaerolineales bacterium]